MAVRSWAITEWVTKVGNCSSSKHGECLSHTSPASVANVITTLADRTVMEKASGRLHRQTRPAPALESCWATPELTRQTASLRSTEEMFGVFCLAFNSELNKNRASRKWRYCLGGGVCSSQPRSVLLGSKEWPVRELQSPLYKDPHTLCSASYLALCPGASYTALRGSGLLSQLWHRKPRLWTN